MTDISKAYATGQFINTGAPAAISLEDEGVVLDNKILSMDFKGEGVEATSDTIGNVQITVPITETVSFIDGGNF